MKREITGGRFANPKKLFIDPVQFVAWVEDRTQAGKGEEIGSIDTYGETDTRTGEYIEIEDINIEKAAENEFYVWLYGCGLLAKSYNNSEGVPVVSICWELIESGEVLTLAEELRQYADTLKAERRNAHDPATFYEITCIMQQIRAVADEIDGIEAERAKRNNNQ